MRVETHIRKKKEEDHKKKGKAEHLGGKRGDRRERRAFIRGSEGKK